MVLRRADETEYGDEKEKNAASDHSRHDGNACELRRRYCCRRRAD